jgi:O-antigen/teichoic acid export membrane protein
MYLLIAGVGAVLLYRIDMLTSVAAQLLMGVAAIAASGVILTKLKHPWLPAPPPIETRSLLREHWNFFRWTGGAGVLSFSQGLVFYLVLPLFSGLESSAALRAMTNFVMPVLQSDSALAVLISPELARARMQTTKMSRIVRWSTRLFALEGVICWVVVAVFRHDLVRLMYGDRYIDYANLLLLLGALPLVASRVNVLGAILRVHRRVRHVFWTSATGAAVALVVGFSTMSSLGAYGAVIAMLAADVVRIAVMTHFIGRRGSPLASDDVDVVAAAGSPRVAEARQ